jgi:hypothetical protein
MSMEFLYLPLKYFIPRFMKVQVKNFNYHNTFLFILLRFMYSMELSSIMLRHLPYLSLSRVKFCGSELGYIQIIRVEKIQFASHFKQVYTKIYAVAAACTSSKWAHTGGLPPRGATTLQVKNKLLGLTMRGVNYSHEEWWTGTEMCTSVEYKYFANISSLFADIKNLIFISLRNRPVSYFR